MAGKTLEIPFSYGEILSVTSGQANVVHFWFRDFAGVIRGVPVDIATPSAPKLLEKEPILIKRTTEGRTRRRRSTLPAVGMSSGSK